MTKTSRIWKPAAVAAAVTIAVVFGFARPSGASADAGLDTEEQTFLALINDYRAQNGAGPLTIDSSLQESAEWMSADLGQHNAFDHTDSQGRDPWTRMCDFGYCHNTWKSENIAAGDPSAQGVFGLWKDSSIHNANMLDSNLKAIGIGRVFTPGSDYEYYWTTDFGGYVDPSAPVPTIEPTPEPTVEPTPEPTPEPTAVPQPDQGDVDCDGDVDAADTLKLIQHVGEMTFSQLTGCPTLGSQTHGGTFGDMDCDGDVDGTDAVRLLNTIAATGTTLPQAC